MTVNASKDLDDSEIADRYPDIYNSLIPLLRTKVDDLDAYLNKVAFDVLVDGTRSKAHCYFISLDGNKRPRAKDFARFIGNRVTDFAIPRSERISALNQSIKTGSNMYVDELNKKARELFTRLPKSGEGGEVLLSLLAETFLRLPQLFTKMVLKTNTEMHVHGSDGIHVGVNPDNGNLAVYWGESKLYGDVAEATRECFSSLAPFLIDDGGSGAAQERDLQLMRDGIDLNSPELEQALKHYLDPNDSMFNKLEYRGLCLIGFDSDAYPKEPNSKEVEQLKTEIEGVFDSRLSHISKRILEERIHSFLIEIFLLPFPNVVEFRKAFRNELGLSDG